MSGARLSPYKLTHLEKYVKTYLSLKAPDRLEYPPLLVRNICGINTYLFTAINTCQLSSPRLVHVVMIIVLQLTSVIATSRKQHHIMPRAPKAAVRQTPFVLNWTDLMHDTFIKALEKQHDSGKRSDTGFKPEAWIFCVARVQNVYTGNEPIPIEKLKNKLDHVRIFNISICKC